MIDYTKEGTNRTTGKENRPRLLTINPGDKISPEPQTIEEKSKQLAVDAPDITGDHITVPTYFIVEYPNGEKKALHHVKDAKAISDVIRQARLNEEVSDQQSLLVKPVTFNISGVIFIVALLVLTLPILIGIF